MGLNASPLLKASRWSVPGKCLLIGEYAVLVGGSAVVLALPPRFRLTVGPLEAASFLGGTPFPSESPAGRWATELGQSLGIEWRAEPRRGWGSSTAEFAALFAASESAAGHAIEPSGWKRAHEQYRQLHAGEAVPPSGADLAVQWQGGLGVLRNLPQAEWVPLPGLDDSARSQLSLFSAARQEGRKTPTHVHLAKMEANLAPFRGLKGLSERAVECFRLQSWEGLGAVVQAWVSLLEGLGLEHPATRADRLAFEAIPGVFGVKGCGAMLSDSVLVVHQPGAQGAVRALGESRGLEWVPIPSFPVTGIEED